MAYCGVVWCYVYKEHFVGAVKAAFGGGGGERDTCTLLGTDTTLVTSLAFNIDKWGFYCGEDFP